MRKTLLSTLLLCIYTSVLGQINVKYNTMRPGDEIIKQQIEYKDPGRSGENVVWDFSQLKGVNTEYIVKYKIPQLINDSIYVMGKDTISSKEVDKEHLLIGIEHGTMYYYLLKPDGLYCLGHENSTTLLSYREEIPVLPFPMNFKTKTNTSYRSKARYSSRIDIYTEGQIAIEADAYGAIILPSKDTLNNTLRIKTIQTYIDIPSYESDSTEKKVNVKVENFKWYVQGYRYPVFETVHTINMEDERNSDYYKTAFFYPPQKHYYLWDDSDNLAVIDSLWDEKNKGQITDNNNPNQNMHEGKSFNYNFYPNPVESDLNIEYLLKENSQVSITLFNMNGETVESISKASQEKGLYTETVSCSKLIQGNYILQIKVNEEIISDKIVKK